MRKLFAFCLLFCALPALAQFTTVSGTVIDPNGIPYANGTIVPTVVASASPTLNGFSYAPPAGPVGLDLTGSFTMNLANQASLLPAGTTWTFNVCSSTGTVQPANGTGPQCFVITGVVIAGATQSLTTALHAAAKALTLGGGSNAVITNPPAGQTVTLSSTDGIHFEQTPCSSLDSTTTNNAACAASFNTFVVASINSTANNLRKGLNIYYQGDGMQGNPMFGLQVNGALVEDANTPAGNAALTGFEVNATMSGALQTAATLYGIDSKPRLYNGMHVGHMVYFHGSSTLAVPAGTTVDSLEGVTIGASVVGTVNSGHGYGLDLNAFPVGLVISGSIRAGILDDTSAARSALCHGLYTIFAPEIYTPHDCWFGGTGSPEGVITAAVGSLFGRQDGAAGTSLYNKMSGAGNTGWLPITSVLVASLVTTAAASDNVTVTGMTAAGHCGLEPTNTLAGTNIAGTFVSAKAANQITVTHTVAANMNYDVLCTPN